MKTICLIVAVLAVAAAALVFNSRTSGCHPPGLSIRQDFCTLISHLDQYRNLGRSYPTNEQGLKALVERPTTEPLPEDWVQALPEIPLDPWENPYRYQMPGSKKDKEPELISAGPDGIFDNEDDLSSQDE